jgi:hypothetical protein
VRFGALSILFSFLFSVVLNYNLIIWATFRQFTFIPILLNISIVYLWLLIFCLPFVLLRPKCGVFLFLDRDLYF